MDAPQPNWITDTKALRALAHPLRWTLLQHLDLESPMTATRAAELTGESVATCSYHLNTLAKYKFVEAAAASNGRERPWRLISYDRSWRAGGEGLDDEGAVAAVALSDMVADEIATHLKAWFRWRSRETAEWVDATALSQGIAYLTPSELAEVTGELRECVDRYVDRVHDASKRPAGARPIRIMASTSTARPPDAEDGPA